jgi:nicotinamide phosphoribosyltransferase
LDATFGSDTNSKGFRVLRHSAVIQGDGINLATLSAILDAVLAAGYAADNVAFGMGGGLLQRVNR